MSESATQPVQRKRARNDEDSEGGADGTAAGHEESSVFEVFDARVHEIITVQNNMLRALCSEFYKEHYPENNITQDTMKVADARVTWNQDPRFVQRRQHADNVEQAANELARTAAANDGDDNQFGQIVEDHNDSVPDIEAMLNYASIGGDSGGGGGGGEYSALKEDTYKRHVAATTIRATVVVKYDDGRKMARVTGLWPVLSSSIMLHIRGTIESKTGAMLSVVALSKNSTIALAPVETVCGREFYNILRESGNYTLQVVRRHVALLFAEPENGVQTNAGVAEAAARPKQPRIVYASRYAAESAQHALKNRTNEEESEQQSLHAQQVIEATYKIAARNYITIGELRRRIAALGDPTIEKMFVRSPFVSLGPLMILRSAELTFIAYCYEDVDITVWREALARGIEYIDILYELATTMPHVLCFARLRKLAGKQRGAPTLGLLPDISLTKYQQLAKAFNRLVPEIDVAVAIYKNILVVDVHGEKRSMDEPFSKVPLTSGHMFTVFADHPDNQNASYFHEDGEEETNKKRLCDENPMSFAGRFQLLPRGAQYTRDMCIWLGVDRKRISKDCTHDDFIAALHWLSAESLVVIERFIGTGKHNRGMPVDAFYLAEIHETQTRLVSLLTDIYERGVAHSLNGENSGDDQSQLSAPRLVALHRVQLAAKARYYQLYTPAVKEIGKAAKSNDETSVELGSDDTEEGNEEKDDNDDDDDDDEPEKPPSLIALLAQRIARDDVEWRRHYEQHMKECKGVSRDAYADVRGTRAHRRLPLLRVASVARHTIEGLPLSDEQIAALERIQWSPMVQVSGRGGVGKSALIELILSMFPPEQVLCVAPTSNVASDLSARTGYKAFTIHSVLTRYSHYLEAHNRAMSYRQRALKYTAPVAANSGGGGGAGAGIVRRAEQFELEDVMGCTDDRELRAYVDHMLEAYPPFVSPFEGKSVLIFDEVSLSAVSIAKSLIDAFHSPRNGRAIRRIIFVGDFDQLMPLGWGSFQSDIGHGMPTTVCELIRNHRSVGTRLFDIAQAMAEHRYTMPMPPFTDRKAAFRAIKNGDDIVALECTPRELVSTIDNVLLELHAIDDLEQRKRVQFISTTNDTARLANEAIRWKYFGENMLIDYQEALLESHRRNPGQPPVDIRDALEKERERINKRLAMQVRVDDRIYLTRNSRVVFSPRNDNEHRYEVQFSNSRRLVAMQFYDAPLRVTKACRCGKCPRPERADDDDDEEEGARGKHKYPCLERLDLVPDRRQKRSEHIKYHDQNVGRGQHGPAFRRMGIFQDDNGNWVEMDVTRMLVPRSRYGNGFTLTTHRLQGSQTDIVVYICVDDRWYINWKFLYTACTRARQRVIILSTQKVFNQLLRRKTPLRRSAMWFELLKNTTAVLKRYPQSAAAAHAREQFPALFDLQRLSSDEQWALLENKRYRTDRAQ